MRIEIDDPNDLRIEVFCGLRDHVLRQRREQPGGDMAGLFIAEGDIVVERAIAAGYEPTALLVDGHRTKPLPVVIADEVPVYACAPQVLTHITGYAIHRGVLACFRRRLVPSVAEVLRRADGVPGLETVLVCEGINNPTNLGVILRCAAGLGVGAFFIDPTCSDPLYRRSGRVSMGEAYSLPYARLEPFPAGIEPLRTAGYRLLALTPGQDSIDLGDLDLANGDRTALLLGAEGHGLTDAALDAADLRPRTDADEDS